MLLLVDQNCCVQNDGVQELKLLQLPVVPNSEISETAVRLDKRQIKLSENKRKKKNDKGFNNHNYSLFFLMDIFLKYLQLIPNILK